MKDPDPTHDFPISQRGFSSFDPLYERLEAPLLSVELLPLSSQVNDVISSSGDNRNLAFLGQGQ